MLDHLLPLISSPWLYVIVFVAVAIDGFLPVMPSETVVIGLGALSSSGSPNLVALAAAVVAGGVAGDRVSYLFGRRAGGRFGKGKLAVAKERAERALLRYGGGAVLVGRFLPYGRTATTMTAGSVSLPLGRFRVFSVLASAAWAAYAIGLGRVGGATFADSPLLGAAFGMVLGAVLAGLHTIVERRSGDQAAAVGVDHGLDPVAQVESRTPQPYTRIAGTAVAVPAAGVSHGLSGTAATARPPAKATAATAASCLSRRMRSSFTPARPERRCGERYGPPRPETSPCGGHLRVALAGDGEASAG
ncbi:DedA family protein [Actinoplanes sp. NPDC051633]|uniref:DedA family protein n=1 Tax=Actinoplanes sp. NPDC051633 TaxID=3155670 RepID=UPI0034396519